MAALSLIEPFTRAELRRRPDEVRNSLEPSWFTRECSGNSIANERETDKSHDGERDRQTPPFSCSRATGVALSKSVSALLHTVINIRTLLGEIDSLEAHAGSSHRTGQLVDPPARHSWSVPKPRAHYGQSKDCLYYKSRIEHLYCL